MHKLFIKRGLVPFRDSKSLLHEGFRRKNSHWLPWRLLVGVLTGLEPITDPRLGQDVFWLPFFDLQLFAEVAYKHAQVFWLFDAVVAPDCRQQSAMGDHFAWMLGQIEQQIKFLGCEMHAAASDLHASAF